VLSADEGDGAVGAAAVAAFGDFEIRVGLVLPFQQAAVAELGPGFAAQGLDEGIQLPGTEPAVYLGDEAGQFVGIPLGQAAKYQKPPNLSFGLPLGGGQNGLDGLLLGVSYEPAGIDEENVYQTGFSFRYYLIRVLYLKKQVLGVYRVLRAPQGDDLEFGH
jgi:hypothetical protein